MSLRKSIIYGAASLALVVQLLVGDVFGFELQLDSEQTNVVREAQKRWARQNHSAAEGHAIPTSDADLFSGVEQQPASTITVE